MRQPPIRIALIGYGFMGRAHSYALNVAARLFSHPSVAQLSILCGPNQEMAENFGAIWGWREVVNDWQHVVDRDDVDAIVITAPNVLHAPIAKAALKNGKHVYCEKPLANTLADAQAMTDIAKKSGRVNMVGFNYRRVPAIALARELVMAGQLGQIYHFRAQYLQNWGARESTPYSWRFSREMAGSGALGDLGSHVIDLARYLVGEFREISGQLKTFITSRTSADTSSGTLVTVDDSAIFSARFRCGATGSFEVSRVAMGRANSLQFEISGTQGCLSFNLERLNELSVCRANDNPLDGPKRVLVTNESHPYIQAWWPDGHVLGWDATVVHAMHDWIGAMATNSVVLPDFEEGLRCQAVINAVVQSAETRSFVEIAGNDGE